MTKKRETFADIVAAAPEPSGQEVEYLQPISSGELPSKIRPYVDGPAPDDHTDFSVAEFKDGEHRSMILVEETC